MITIQTPIPLALTFDDVLIVPKRTRAESRSVVDLSTRLTPRIRLRLPFVSANVPWCTESAMAMAMAKAGGIGLLHRMNTPDQEAEEIKLTKAHRFLPGEFPDATTDQEGRLLVGAAIGANDDALTRAELLVGAGVDVLVVDVAHGHADCVLRTIEVCKHRYPEIEIIAGNVATGEGARDLIDAGVDAIKVGVGPGSICTTRLVTGSGIPQLSAIIACVDQARKRDIPVIADGGLRTSGDITKALAAGASTVMMGGMLAGVDESAAIAVVVDGERYKITTGFVSLGMKLTLKKQNGEPISAEEFKRYVPEGVEATFKHLGPLADTLLQYAGGVRSGISYSGAMSLPELWEKAEFVQISSAGVVENTPHAWMRSNQIHSRYPQNLQPSSNDGTLGKRSSR